MNKKQKKLLKLFVGLVVTALVVGGLAYFLSGGQAGVGYMNDSSAEYDYAVAETSMAGNLSADEGLVAQSAPKALRAMDGEVMEESGSVDDLVSERMIIKTGSLSLVVEDVRDAIAQITTYAEANGGFVVSSNTYKYDLSLSGDVVIRIPSEVFDKGVGDVKALGEVTSESVYGQDVTEEFVDLEAQLTNLRATETQFLEIMKRAVEIEDVLAVQKELNWVRGDIERIEGRMKYLQESSTLSTLTVYLATDPAGLPIVDDEDTWKPIAVVKDAVRALIDAGQWVVNAGIWVVIYSPVWIAGLLLLWAMWKLAQWGWKKL